MRTELLCVFLGGGAGSICRYVIGSYLLKAQTGGFPWGTLTANVLGCLLIGLLLGWFERRGAGLGQLLLVTGFCGGFTTFSTFSNETVQFLRQGATGVALCYAGVSIGAGLLLCTAGYCLVKCGS